MVEVLRESIIPVERRSQAVILGLEVGLARIAIQRSEVVAAGQCATRRVADAVRRADHKVLS